MIQIEDLEKIIKIVEKHDISHFEFEQNDSRVVIEKQSLKPVFNNKANNSEIKVINEYINGKEDNLFTNHEKIDKNYIKIKSCRNILFKKRRKFRTICRA